MTEELSRHQIKGLAQDNVGALDEVEEAVELLRRGWLSNVMSFTVATTTGIIR